MSAPSPTNRGVVPRRGASVTRERILAAATDLFSTNGIRGTSADRIIEQVGITKVTFYRHFATKTDLAVAYLEEQAAGEREAISHVIARTSGVGSLRAIAALIGEASCSPGFRGCPFINAAAETPDPDDPVRDVVRRHRQWMRDLFAAIAIEVGADDGGITAGQLMMLRDGAMVDGYLMEPAVIATELTSAYEAVVAALRRD